MNWRTQIGQVGGFFLLVAATAYTFIDYGRTASQNRHRATQAIVQHITSPGQVAPPSPEAYLDPSIPCPHEAASGEAWRGYRFEGSARRDGDYCLRVRVEPMAWNEVKSVELPLEVRAVTK